MKNYSCWLPVNSLVLTKDIIIYIDRLDIITKKDVVDKTLAKKTRTCEGN